ncbi:DNA polymerase/3'-5' exonuclease PolX [Rhodocaloribacter litoris]|uniref:DNA polymerase/3'-5' exonuclease PolX n=1 Tax=Rhodocaloribacter litoris TaxID=2558931 RepID=UPI001421C5D9|nr:DNA polymerase/3'-5' exonuclease PolX [Rhodocaloribacter litoris]QXD15294.1 DNA polymerase/3'-5' exonuclease PolX [Rhodocaloribacter litoris]
MTNKAVARLFHETAALLELTGGNPFRARAYRQAARVLERLDEPLAERLAARGLTDLPGIGEGLEAQVREILARGSFELRDTLRSAVPAGLLEVLQVQGLGPKKVRVLWQQLGITSLDALEHAAETGRLASLAGFGPRTQETVLEQIRRLRAYGARMRLDEASARLEAIAEAAGALPHVRTVAVAGEVRRGLETVGQADLVVGADSEADLAPVLDGLVEAIEQLPDRPAGEVLLHGRLGTGGEGLPFRARIVPPDRFGTALWEATGSHAHCTAFIARYGPPAPQAREEEVYAAAGLPFIPPELREGRGEIEAAATGTLPELITVRDLRGTLHNHSTYSDGTHPLARMAEAAFEMGYEYFGICDHSRSLKVAHGLSIDDVRRQHEEIDRLNRAYAGRARPFRIFKGIESDILPDGALDYPDDVLASFDLVVASIHTGLNMTRDEATRRLLTAIENPFTTILGHPTGRLLLSREGYPIDHEAILAACARHGVAIELNANPRRLDLDWRWVRTAVERGVMIAINPDAHAVEQLELVRWGVAVARKGWLTPAHCLNALPLDAFTRWLEERRRQRR